jgi:solute:Na+ symporter, SSS family
MLGKIDLLTIIIYFIINLGLITFFRKKDGKNTFLLDNKLTLPAFVMTLVPTWYGAIVGVGELAYNYGLSSWFIYGLPSHIFCLIIAFILVKKFRKGNYHSLPDRILHNYGEKTCRIAAISIYLCTVPAAYLLMLSLVLHYTTGISVIFCNLIITIFAASYLIFGGFRFVRSSNAIDFIMMYVGFIILFYFCYTKIGDFTFLKNNLNPVMLEFTGSHSILTFISWYFVSMLIFIEPNFYHRSIAAKSKNIAKYGILISVVFWLIFDFFASSSGLYAQIALPNIDAKMSYLMLADMLIPSGLKGIFIVTIIALIWSTYISYNFVSGQILGQDFIGTFMDDRKNNFLHKIGILISSILSFTIASISDSVINILYSLPSIALPGILSIAFFKLKLTDKECMMQMITTLIIAGTWNICGHLGFDIPQQIPTIFIGFISSFCFISYCYVRNALYKRDSFVKTN